MKQLENKVTLVTLVTFKKSNIKRGKVGPKPFQKQGFFG